jgi:hypothetical protein
MMNASDHLLGQALLFESTLAVLKPPPLRTFEAVQHAFNRYNDQEKRWDPVLGGFSASLYSQKDTLILLKQPIHEDRVTAFVQKYLAIFFTVGAFYLC